MKSILFGNGLNMKFGGNQYGNGKILRRGLNVLRQDKKMHKICPPETLDFFNVMYKSIPDILNGLYDDASTDCVLELRHFKESYSNRVIDDVGEIGMEDYFLVIHLIFVWQRKHNPDVDSAKIYSEEEEKTATECFRDLCLVGIYNFGKINKLHLRYSSEFTLFINQFDNVFTTNYDLNLDKVFKGTVQHIHGQFNILDQLYDPKSFRNSLSDNQFSAHNLTNIRGYEYLHSTALMNYSGANKYEHIMAEHNLNNLSLEDILAVPEGMAKSKDIRLAIEARKRMDENPSLKYQEYDAYESFKNITGDLSIVGLSSTNDNHIFKQVDKLNTTFYYYSDGDRASAKKIMPVGTELKEVVDFWGNLHC